MKLYYLPALAALAAAPTAVDGYCVGGRRSLFSSPMVVYTPDAMLRRQRALAKQIFRRPRSSPRYEITDNDDVFQLAVDVPGVEASDISITVENDMLTLSGERKLDKDSYSFASKFYQSFSLDPAIEVDNITAELKNGVLYVVAPKDLKRVEENVKRIPIKQVTEEKEVVNTNDTQVKDETDVKASQSSEETDRKEEDQDAAEESQE